MNRSRNRKTNHHSVKHKFSHTGLGLVIILLTALNIVGLYLFSLGARSIWSVTDLTPRDYLRRQCDLLNCDFALLDAIITCESHWQMVQNPSSSAYGYFQILDATEETTPQYARGESKFNPYSNLDMGLYLYLHDGARHWNESRGCWGSKY
jgi:GDP-D-mannose dehydratase